MPPSRAWRRRLLDYMVVTNAKWWNGLPPDIREGLTKAMKEATAVNNKIADDPNKEAKAKIAASSIRAASRSCCSSSSPMRSCSATC